MEMGESTSTEVRFFTVDEVAGLMRVSGPFIHKLISQGELPVFRIGRRVLISVDDLEQFLASRRTKQQ